MMMPCAGSGLCHLMKRPVGEDERDFFLRILGGAGMPSAVTIRPVKVVVKRAELTTVTFTAYSENGRNLVMRKVECGGRWT